MINNLRLLFIIHTKVIELNYRSLDYNVLVLLLSCYLSPEISVWGINSHEFFSQILSLMYLYSESGFVFIFADSNTRIGHLSDIFNIVTRTCDQCANQHDRKVVVGFFTSHQHCKGYTIQFYWWMKTSGASLRALFEVREGIGVEPRSV